jgi:peptide/nickel transport system ATP-binding protein
MGLVDPPGRIVDGRIMLDGTDLRALTGDELRQMRGNRVAMIFQDPMMTLNPVLRIDVQMIEAILAHEKISEDAARARAREALTKVGIPSANERLNAYPHQFSGGMRQRVAIAIALLNRPDLIIADEPTTALDVTIQLQYLTLLREIQARTWLAMLFITHDFGIVARMCDRVAVMYAGRIVESGPMRELFAAPRHPYTQALMAAVPKMNARPERLVAIDGQPPALQRLPPGCRFAERCRYADDRCRREYPPAFTVGPAHEAACWRAEPAAPRH